MELMALLLSEQSVASGEGSTIKGLWRTEARRTKAQAGL